MSYKEQCGAFFSDDLKEEIRSKIAMVDHDTAGKRIFFENAGGSLTLKSVCDLAGKLSEIPDCHNRPTPGAKPLANTVKDGIADAKLFFGAKSGSILADLTVSKSFFTMTGVIMSNVRGTNVVTTSQEHPCTHDACRYHGLLLGKELRVSSINPTTGYLDVDDLISKVDLNTSLLSFIHASNILGTVNDVERIIEGARKKNPDIFIMLDSTQHIPHGSVDVEALKVDACGFAPYKILAKRGLGIGWVGDRVADMLHPHFLEGASDDWDLGGYEYAGMAALCEVVDYISWIGSKYSKTTDRRELFIAGMEAIEQDERAIMYRMLHGSVNQKGVLAMKNVEIFFMDDLTKRDCILPLAIQGMESADVARKYIANGIYCFDRSRNNKMSRRILEGANIPNIVRVSPMHFHTKTEIDEFLQVTEAIAGGKL